MCYSAPIPKTPNERFFGDIDCWFIEIVKGCDNAACTHPCDAVGKEYKEISPKLLSNFIEIVQFFPIFQGAENSGTLVLYGQGDVSDYKFPTHINIPHMWQNEITITKNYVHSPARKTDRLNTDVYAKVFSIDDINEVLKLKTKEYKGIILTVQKDIDWKTILEIYIRYTENHRGRIESLKIQSLDQSTKENAKNYVPQSEVVKFVKEIMTGNCLMPYFTFLPIQKQGNCDYKLTPVIQDIIKAHRKRNSDTDVEFNVRLCFSSRAPVHEIRMYNNFTDYDRHDAINSNHTQQLNSLKKFLQQKPKCSEWCNFGERWRATSGRYTPNPSIDKFKEQLNKNPFEVIIKNKEHNDKYIQGIKKSYTCSLCGNCEEMIKAYKKTQRELQQVCKKFNL